MTEIKRISRAVEMSPEKEKAFASLIKTCNGAITKNRSLYLSKESPALDMDVERELKKCSQLDSGITNAIMLIFGRPNLDNLDYTKLDVLDPKDQGLIRELHVMFNEDKLSEAITLGEKILEEENVPGVKGVLFEGINKIKQHLQEFRPVWREYQDHAEPLDENGKRLPRGEMESPLVYNRRTLMALNEEIGMEEDKLKRLRNRANRVQEENAKLEGLLGTTIVETREEAEEVVGGGLLYFPTRPGRREDVAQGVDISPAGEQLVADFTSGMDVTEDTDMAKGKVIPIKKGATKGEIPDDIA